MRLNPLLKLKRRKSKSLPWKKQDHRMTFRQLSKTKEEAGSGPLAPALPNPLLKLKKRKSKSQLWKRQSRKMTFRQRSRTKEEAGYGPLALVQPSPYSKTKSKRLSLTKKNKKKWLKKKCKSSQQSMRRTPLKKVR